MSPTLYVVATPIGNKQDMTYRAVQILQSVDVIAAEDKRHSAPLLAHYNIDTPMLAVHEHNEKQRVVQLLQRLQAGESVALITDAGTPLISDPGYHLVNHIKAAGFPVVPVVGPSAVIAALSVAGIATDHFTFMGYLPAKAKARCQLLASMKASVYTHVFYETPHRIVSAIADMIAVLGEKRQVAIARELTKTFETIKTAPLSDIQTWMLADENQQRGEFVVVVAGAEKPSVQQVIDADTVALISVLLQELPIKKVARVVAKLTPHTKQTIYQFALTLQNNMRPP